MDIPASLLIHNAELLNGARVDVRIAGGRIAMIGAIAPERGEPVISAQGGLLIPGLHDHHLHLAATAAARASVPCGPPNVLTAAQLATQLAQPGTGWLRGTAYHESVAGMLDRAWLDRIVPDRPVRIQHRSGRMWFFNSAGLDLLLTSEVTPPPGLDRQTGQLFDSDLWMRSALGSQPPSLDALGADLAALGITGVTDMNPANGPVERAWLAAETLPHRVVVAGTLSLAGLDWAHRRTLGPLKVHLHQAALIPHHDFISLICAAHDQGRGVAVHCVTEIELVYTLAALEEAGAHPADRIEHASVTPDTLLTRIEMLGLAVVTQPLFVAERGDAYRRDIPEAEWPDLYRLRSFIDAGVPLAGSSDAPYVDIDPWAGMRAAIERRTQNGASLGEAEALTPEQALALYLADPADLRVTRKVATGRPADLCLLDRPWAQARDALSADRVRLTFIGGDIVYQAP